MKKIFSMMLLFATVVMLASCQKDDEQKGDEPKDDESGEITVTGVTLNETTLSLIKGAKETLIATVAPDDVADKTVTWESSNTAVATVNATTGEVEAKAVGEVTITATSTSNSDMKGTCEVKVIEWATGNLVAKADGSGCVVGTSADAGLYFQFGSLIGWSTTGDPSIAVSPAGYTGSTSWNSSWSGDPSTDNAVTGKGDPCRYYLGGAWRLPTIIEYQSLFKNNGFPSTGPWVWDAATHSATNSTKNLTFPGSGFRVDSNGGLNGVEASGYYWSSSPMDANGYYLRFYDYSMSPGVPGKQALGFTVRCVRESN